MIRTFPGSGTIPTVIAVLLALSLLPAWARDGAAPEPVPSDVHIQLTDIEGPVYADGRGRTLYIWEGDEVGKSHCGSDRYTETTGLTGVAYHLPEPDIRPTCKIMWPPLPAPADAVTIGAWTVVLRADGDRQWAYQGRPVYTSSLDLEAGDVNGLGFTEWGRRNSKRTVLHPPSADPPDVATVLTTEGRVLATSGGLSRLYINDRFRGADPACRADCRLNWRPFLAPALAQDAGKWSVIAGERGQRQWAYDGHPLYTSSHLRAADVLEDGDLAAGWRLAVAQARPSPPAQFKIEPTAAGDVYASAEGKTLYFFECAEETPDGLLCDVLGRSPIERLTLCGGPDKCAATWRVVPAAANARPPNRTWTIVTIDPRTGARIADPNRKDGQSVWAYRGRTLYTFAGDAAPGDANGDGTSLFNVKMFRMVLVDQERPSPFP